MKNNVALAKGSLPPSRPVDLRIGPYDPCFEIGTGGMATVYIARERGDSGLRRTVALKVMHEHLARRDDFRSRFLDEARVLTQIAHPYVCRVAGFGEELGRPFMAMEYLIGEPLSRVFRAMKRRGHGMPTRQRARLFARVIADLAEGLHAAHEARDHQGRPMGLVHRDVTPHNLFLLYDGTVRVLDFGVARFADRDVQTVSNVLLGKLPYMAPEQVQGESYDRRVDVWALGVVFWELVTLGRLFKRETEVCTLRAVCADPIPRVDEFIDDVPEGLDDVLAPALERDATRRYASARAFSQALEHWLAKTGEPVTHASLSEYLSGFFPGSQLERQRWAEHSSPGSGVRRAAISSVTQQALSRPAKHRPPKGPRLAFDSLADDPSGELATSPFTRDRHSDGDDDDDVTAPRQQLEPTTTSNSLNAALEEVRASPSRVNVAVARHPDLANEPTRLNSRTQPPAERRQQRRWLGLGLGLCGLTLLVAAASTQTRLASPFTEPADAPTSTEPERPDSENVEATADGTALRAPTPDQQAAQEATAPPSLPVDETPASVSEKSAPAEEPESVVSPATDREHSRAPRSPAVGESPSASRNKALRADTGAEPGTRKNDGPNVSKGDPADERSGTSATEAHTGDVLIVSSTPGVQVLLGGRLLGVTPVKTRLPAGPNTLSVRVGADGQHVPMATNIKPGRLNVLTVNLGQ